MRIIVMTLIGAMLVLAPGTSAIAGQPKVTICHKGNTITIGAPAVDAHERNHGDTIGACAEGGIGPVDEPVGPPPTTTTTIPDVQTCFEDEPCWDCETMGNKICGPVTQPPDDHNTHDDPPPHSHDEMVLRCTVIDE